MIKSITAVKLHLNKVHEDYRLFVCATYTDTPMERLHIVQQIAMQNMTALIVATATIVQVTKLHSHTSPSCGPLVELLANSTQPELLLWKVSGARWFPTMNSAIDITQQHTRPRNTAVKQQWTQQPHKLRFFLRGGRGGSSCCSGCRPGMRSCCSSTALPRFILFLGVAFAPAH